MVPPWPDLRRDVAPAVALTALVVLGTVHISHASAHRPIDAVAWVCVGVACAAQLVRRRWPGTVLVLTAAALLTYVIRQYDGGPIYVAGALALYSYSVTVDRWRAAVTGTVLATVLFTGRAVASGELAIGLLNYLWAAVAVLAADAVRSAGERRRQARRQREEETLRRLAEDRLRIARDLHDSVAHAITAINVQAGVAAHRLERDPAGAAPALEAIRVASRDVLEELTAMLAVLRRGESAPLTPVPELADLDALVASSQRAGLHVELHRGGDASQIPAAVSTAAYRIVQEALTNVARHAGTSRAEVTVKVQPAAEITVEVVDDGDGTGSFSRAGSGRGLDGIRERAANTGGSVELGPRPAGGFAVRARWPAGVPADARNGAAG
ncbi:MAG TPA: sensor histidine kinase [Jatrophihabitantaceae bacterium]